MSLYNPKPKPKAKSPAPKAPDYSKAFAAAFGATKKQQASVTTPPPPAPPTTRFGSSSPSHHEPSAEEVKHRKVERQYTHQQYENPTGKRSPFGKVQKAEEKARENVTATREELLNPTKSPTVEAHSELGQITKSPTTQAAYAPLSKEQLAHPAKSPETQHVLHAPPKIGAHSMVPTSAKKFPAPRSSNPLEGAVSDVFHYLKGNNALTEQPGGAAGAAIIGNEAKNLATEFWKHNNPYPSSLPGQGEGLSPTAGQTQFLLNLPAGDFALRGAEELPKIFDTAKSLGSTASSAKNALKSTPEILKNLPKAAKEAVREAPTAAKGALKATPGAAKVAAKAAPGVAGRAGLRTSKGALNSFGGTAALAAADHGNTHIPGGSILKGQWEALQHNPGKVLSSTANLFPSLLVSALQLPYAAGKSAVQGNTGPLEGALNTQKDFAEYFAKTYLSNNPKAIEHATLQEGLLPEVLGFPLGAKAGEKAGELVKPKILEKSKRRRSPSVDGAGNVVLNDRGAPVKKGNLRTGQEEHLTRHGEINAHRREEAFHAAQMNDLIQLEHHKRMQGVERHAYKSAAKGKKTVIAEGLGKKGKDKLEARGVDFIPFLNRASIDLHNPDAALRELQHYAERYKGLKPTRDYGLAPEALNARDAVNFFLENPDELHDPHLAKALDAYRDMANGNTGLNAMSTSERNRYLGHAVMHDIPLPEDRVPMGARAHTHATTREGAWADLKARDKQIEKLRKEARQKRIEAKALGDTPRGKRLARESKLASQRAKVLKGDREALHAELNPFTRPGAKANAPHKRIAYDEALEKEMVDETRASLKEKGLHPEPAYFPDIEASKKAISDSSVTGGKKPSGPGPKTNEGYVHEHGLSRQGYAHLSQQVLAHVARNESFKDWRRFDTERGLSFNGKSEQNGKSWQQAFDTGSMNPRDVTLVPVQNVRRFEKATQGGTPTEYEEARSALFAAKDMKKEDIQPGTIYRAYPKAAFEEKLAQAQKSPVPQWISKANSYTSRAMLSTPSFIAYQEIAEGLQGLAEVNPVRAAQGLKGYNALSPKQRLKVSAAAGETAAAIFTPEDLQTSLSSPNHDPFGDSLNFFRRNVFGRAAKDVVTGKAAGNINRRSGGLKRRATLTGAVARDVNGMMTKGRRLLNFQTEIQKKLNEATKGLHGQAKINKAVKYVADNPQLLDHYGKLTNDAMGGWTNLIRSGHVPETARSAGLMFYPFLRMSLLWPIKYAVNHPIKATALAYLAAENNWALRQALQGEPSFFNYAQIPTWEYNSKGQIVSGGPVDLSRASPGGNALVTGIQGAGTPLGALQPVAGAIVAGIAGSKSPAEIAGNILNLSPYIRAADTLKGQKATGQSEFGILAERANVKVEPLAALEAKLKGSAQEQVTRSLVGPPLKERDLGKARDSAKLGRILDALSKNGTTAQYALNPKSQGEEKTVRKQVEAMQRKNAKAKTELEALYRKYGVIGASKKSEEIFNYTHPYPSEQKKKGAYEGTGYEGSGYEGTGYGGSKTEKPPTFPKGTNGVSLPGLPNVGGVLGSIASPLTSLVGGTTAQAAEVKSRKGGKAPSRTVASLPNIEGLPHQEQKEFAQYLSHYSKLPPKLVGEWVKQESGGYSAGGQAGRNNWLGVGYPAHQTPFSQSPYFNGSPKRAAKATSEWIEGKIGGQYGYKAAPSIQYISKLAKSGTPEAQIRSYIEGPSGWGTGTIAQSGVTVNGKTADVVRGSTPKTVYVRADAKGMVQWAKANLGTQEGSQKQVNWASKQGLSASQPWCANFISNGLARRGVALPPNPNYVPSYEHEWTGGKNIGSDLSKAKPGDLITFSGQHIGLYVGNGEMISGNFGNQVSRDPVSADSTAVSMILRPSYKGGKVKVRAGAPLSGEMPATIGATISAAAPNGEAPSTTATKQQQRKEQRGLTAAQKLKQVEGLYRGELTQLGVPGYSSKKSPDLAAIGRSVEETRRRLLAT